MTQNPTSYDEWSPQGPVTELSDEASWELLNDGSFGRLGVSLDNLPEIFPVNYHSDGASVLFRTASGTKLHDLLSNSRVVFEADAQLADSAWSVTVKGAAAVLTEVEDIASADRQPLPHWIPTAPYVYVRVAVDSIRGRVFTRRLPIERTPDRERTEESAELD